MSGFPTAGILIAYFTWADNTQVDNPEKVDVDVTTSASVLPPTRFFDTIDKVAIEEKLYYHAKVGSFLDSIRVCVIV